MFSQTIINENNIVSLAKSQSIFWAKCKVYFSFILLSEEKASEES